MPIELSWLVASVVLYGVMILTQGLFSNLEHKGRDLAGARDNIVDHGVRVLRAKRANHNMVEALLMFAPLVLVAVVAGRTNELTALGGVLFFLSRVAYAPLYWFGVPYLRSLAWFGGVIATVLVLIPIFPFT